MYRSFISELTRDNKVSPRFCAHRCYYFHLLGVAEYGTCRFDICRLG